MLRTAVALFFTLTTGAQALSCAPYGPTDSTLHAMESEELYTVVYGHMSWEAQRVQVHSTENGWQFQTWTIRIEGHRPSRNRFDVPFSDTATFQQGCFDGSGDNFCDTGNDKIDALENSEPSLMFINGPDDNGDYTLHNWLCGGSVYPTPSRNDLRKVLRCLRGGSCRPTEQY